MSTQTHTHSNSYTCDTCRQSSLSRLENFGQDEAFAWGRTRYPENKLHTNYIELTKKLSAVHRVLQKTWSKITNAASKSRLTVDPQSVSNRDELLSVPFDSDFRHDWRIFKGMPSTLASSSPSLSNVLPNTMTSVHAMERDCCKDTNSNGTAVSFLASRAHTFCQNFKKVWLWHSFASSGANKDLISHANLITPTEGM